MYHRGRHPRLLPTGRGAGQAGDRQAGGRWRVGTGGRRGLVGTGVFACRADDSATRPRHGAAVSVRPADLLPSAGRAAVRISLPHRDLHAGEQRQYGYYVWPFLLDGELVGRVDLKADRSADALHVAGAFVEADRPPSLVADAMAGELQTMAGWLGLAGVTVGERGDLVGPLRKAVARR
jgi:uncharacterized protein YcaQ